MVLNQFVKEINDELSQDCQIPFKVSAKSLMRTIRWAKKWFWIHCEHAVEETYIVIKQDQFHTAKFELDRKICLGDRIISVFDIYRMNGSGLLGDFSIDRLNAQEIYRYGQNGVNGAADIEYYVARRVSFDWLNQLLSHTISFDYNRLTQELMLVGEAPKIDIVVHCYRAIPDEALFEDELFFRYVLAKAKMDLGRIIGTIKMNMIGNAEINYDMIKEDGKEELENIKNEIKDDNGVDYLFES